MNDQDQPTTSGPSTGSPASPASTMSTTSAQTLARCLAVLSAVAAIIHFDVANEHYQEYWAFGVFMVGAGLLQGAWTGAALLSMKRWVWATGAVINGGIVVVYIVTRTVGDVVGPTPHELEPVGFGDAFCTVLEALIAVGCLALLLSRSPQPVRARSSNLTVGATGVVAAVLLVVALLDGGPEMSMSMSDDASGPVAAAPAAATTHSHTSGMKNMPGMTSSSSSSGTSLTSLRLTTRSPAGAVTTMTGMNMGGGMKDVSAPCTAMPTAAQQAATVKLVNTSWRDVQKFRSLAAAKAAGYVPITPTGLPIVHYLNLKSYEATAEGGPVITPKDPESLVYANTPKGAVLAATMYLSRPGTVDPPQPGGCLTPWHIHTNLCFGSFGTVVGLTTAGECASGSVHRVTPPMMHVWYVPIPGGPTAVDGTDAQIVRAAEHVKAPHNGTA